MQSLCRLYACTAAQGHLSLAAKELYQLEQAGPHDDDQ